MLFVVLCSPSTESKYGDMDITGESGMEFFSNRIKVTSKWPVVRAPTVGNGGTNGSSAKRRHDEMASDAFDSSNKDAANFAGSM